MSAHIQVKMPVGSLLCKARRAGVRAVSMRLIFIAQVSRAGGDELEDRTRPCTLGSPWERVHVAHSQRLMCAAAVCGVLISGRGPYLSAHKVGRA